MKLPNTTRMVTADHVTGIRTMAHAVAVGRQAPMQPQSNRNKPHWGRPRQPRRWRLMVLAALAIAAPCIYAVFEPRAFAEFKATLPDLVAAAGDGWRLIVHDGSNFWQAASVWVEDHYQRVPTLILGLGLILLLPIVAVFVSLAERLWMSAMQPNATRRLKSTPPPHIENRSTSLDGSDAPPRWPSMAWLEVEGYSRRVRIGGEVVQIGRESDTDVVIPDPTVHRYHATVHRDADGAFIISDLAAPYGNGVYVNGRRVVSAHLNAGDRITVGRRELRFVSQPI